jgi:hypothetical protein
MATTAQPGAGAAGEVPVALVVADGAAGSGPVAAAHPSAHRQPLDPEEDYASAHGLVWNSIFGAMNASQLYIGDKLGLFATLRKMCAAPGSSVSTNELARETGFHRRWLREWVAGLAGIQVLQLVPAPDEGRDGGDGTPEDEYDTVRFRLPKAMGEVLANPASDEYDVCMVQLVPALLNRARTMLPDAFRTGIGRPYDDADITEAIDRQNRHSFRTVLLPKVLPLAGLTEPLARGIAVAELGCGGGNLLVALAEAFPASTFDGFEVSAPALEMAAAIIQERALGDRVRLHDATKEGGALGDAAAAGGAQYDLVVVHDVLHDCPFPVSGWWAVCDPWCSSALRGAGRGVHV